MSYLQISIINQILRNFSIIRSSTAYCVYSKSVLWCRRGKRKWNRDKRKP